MGSHLPETGLPPTGTVLRVPRLHLPPTARDESHSWTFLPIFPGPLPGEPGVSFPPLLPEGNREGPAEEEQEEDWDAVWGDFLLSRPSLDGDRAEPGEEEEEEEDTFDGSLPIFEGETPGSEEEGEPSTPEDRPFSSPDFRDSEEERKFRNLPPIEASQIEELDWHLLEAWFREEMGDPS